MYEIGKIQIASNRFPALVLRFLANNDCRTRNIIATAIRAKYAYGTPFGRYAEMQSTIEILIPAKTDRKQGCGIYRLPNSLYTLRYSCAILLTLNFCSQILRPSLPIDIRKLLSDKIFITFSAAFLISDV